MATMNPAMPNVVPTLRATSHATSHAMPMPASPTQNACVQSMRPDRRPLSSCATQPVPSEIPKNPKTKMTMYIACPPRARRLAGWRRGPAAGCRAGGRTVRVGRNSVEHTGGGYEPLGPLYPLVVPRFAGPATLARLPRLDQVDRCDVAVVGVPFHAGTTYRPGARF